MRFLLFTTCLFLACHSLLGAPPEWVAKAAAVPTPEPAGDAPAVILLDDCSMEVNENGVATIRQRKAVRILHLSGRDNAAESISYNSASDKVHSTDCWLLRDGKDVRRDFRTDWIDASMNEPGVLLTEMRTRGISYAKDALPGDVFVFEASRSTPLLFAQWGCQFDNELPVVGSRLQVSLPEGFKMETLLLGDNKPRVDVSGQGDSCVWSYQDLPYKPDEPLLHPRARENSRLLMRIIPRPGLTDFKPKSITSWKELAAWDESLNQGQCDSSPDLKAKVLELTKDSPDTLSKIRAVCSYVQKLRYIAFNQNLRTGEGWKVRKASLVFSTGYGDCKDKSNLLEAMLKELGIRSYRTSAYASRASEVIPDFPAASQFNHAILAIEADDAISLRSVVQAPDLGRLLFFDPTDSETPLGDLPYGLQGSLVHVNFQGNDHLTKLPSFTAEEDFAIDRKMLIEIQTDGSVSAKGSIRGTAQSGAALRHKLVSATTPKALETFISKQLSDTFRRSVITEKRNTNDPFGNFSELNFACTLKRFAQPIQPGKAVVKLDVFSRQYLPVFPEKERRLPIELKPIFLKDEITLILPSGFSVDELPSDANASSKFGNYHTRYSIEGQTLKVVRTLQLEASTVPTTDYAPLKQFLVDISRLSRTALVIKHGS